MRPLLQRASRSIFANASFSIPSQSPQSSRAFGRCFTKPASSTPSSTPSSCTQYQLRPKPSLSCILSTKQSQRQFSTSRASFEEKKPSNHSEPLRLRTNPPSQDSGPSSINPATHPPPPPSPPSLLPPPPPPPPPSASKIEDTIARTRVQDTVARVPAEDLPSHREGQRWSLSKRLSELMDELLPKLAIVTQKVNTYTGTDYSGIEALRREIKDQEKLVKARRLAIDEAKQILDSAHAQQGSSQKEVVALLERKHSWSAIDLERYMALIRSEHINDQAVNRAKEAVQEAENALEEARSHLEKRERAQYHEEQIWSDTIRRNSTWVTFGLMGLNIFLLLVSLVAIEPWRRSKMVKEIRRALNAQKTAMESTIVEPARAALPASPVKAEIDAAVVSAVRSPEAVISEASIPSLPPAVEAVKAVEATIPAQGSGSNVRADPSNPGSVAQLTPVGVDSQEAINIEEGVNTSTAPDTWYGKIKFAALDLVSDRAISVRKIDFTTAVFQAATAGAVLSAALIALIRSR